MKSVYLILILNCTVFQSFQLMSQDIVTFMDGKIIIGEVLEANPSYVDIQVEKGNEKVKIKSFAGYRVFKINYKDGKEEFIYEQDVELGNEMTTHMVGKYIEGLNEAKNEWKIPWVTIGGFATGYVGAGFDPFYGPIAPTLFAISIGFSSPGRNKLIVTNEADIGNDYFVRGYQQQVRHKKIKNAVKGGVLGFGLGLLTRIILNLNSSSGG